MSISIFKYIAIILLIPAIGQSQSSTSATAKASATIINISTFYQTESPRITKQNRSPGQLQNQPTAVKFAITGPPYSNINVQLPQNGQIKLYKSNSAGLYQYKNSKFYTKTENPTTLDKDGKTKLTLYTRHDIDFKSLKPGEYQGFFDIAFEYQ